MSRTFVAATTQFDRLSNADYAMTLDEVGIALGVCRERVRQIEKRALAKLRKSCMFQLLEMRDLAIAMRRNSGRDCHGVIR